MPQDKLQEISAQNDRMRQMVNIPMILLVSIASANNAFVMVFFKFGGELYQEEDLASTIFLVIILFTVSAILATSSLVLLNYSMRDYDQLSVIPIY